MWSWFLGLHRNFLCHLSRRKAALWVWLGIENLAVENEALEIEHL